MVTVVNEGVETGHVEWLHFDLNLILNAASISKEMILLKCALCHM